MGAEPVPVTFVSSSAEIGGAELLLESLCNSLGPGWVDAVVIPEPGELAERLASAGYRVEVVPFGRRLGLVAAAVRLRRVLDRRGAMIVHANGSRAALVAALAGRRRRGLVWLRVDRTLDGPVAALIAGRCDRVVAISNNTLQGLGRRAAKRAEVVYPGIPNYEVDRDAGRSFALSLVGCPTDAELIVLSGRLVPAKGQADLLDAAPAVLANRPRARVVLLGGAQAAHRDYEAELRDRARQLGIEARVAFPRPSGEAGSPRSATPCAWSAAAMYWSPPADASLHTAGRRDSGSRSQRQCASAPR